MSHGNIQHQMQDIEQAWKLSQTDRLLHFLPLHHTHGILVNLQSPLYAGATLEMLPCADPAVVWKRVAQDQDTTLTMMMAVPTIYMKLLDYMDQWPDSDKTRKQALKTVRQMRLMISGSAACPVGLMRAWENLTTHRLLERYGMTEVGMALTNPLDGKRHVGMVGSPFPSVNVCLNTKVQPIDTNGIGTVGELKIKGPTVFQRYWRRPEETAKAFDAHGWFNTGDMALYDPICKSYRLLGRISVDVIKSGGYKISALEIETVIDAHPDVAEVAVVGIQDDLWGQRVTAFVRFHRDGTNNTARPATLPSTGACLFEDLQTHTKKMLARYKVPKTWIPITDLPKNAMGKVNKHALMTTLTFDQKP